MKHLDIKQIQEIIPHRHPFLLLDYVEDYEPGEYAVPGRVLCRTFSTGAGHAGGADRGSAGTGRCGSDFK